tara:strand:+ start:172 stop:606 length:435 start_codon:yes stop_codon:yes gene_type:complete
MLRKYQNRIRPISISIIRNDDKILVYQREDDITKEKFYRLIGGCIEFGESSKDALKREFQEELSLDLLDIQFIKSFESIFEFNNSKMHEIVYLFDSKFEDKTVYTKEVIPGLEGERAFKAIWLPISIFKEKKETIYPEEIIDYL